MDGVALRGISSERILCQYCRSENLCEEQKKGSSGKWGTFSRSFWTAKIAHSTVDDGVETDNTTSLKAIYDESFQNAFHVSWQLFDEKEALCEKFDCYGIVFIAAFL